LPLAPLSARTKQNSTSGESEQLLGRVTGHPPHEPSSADVHHFARVGGQTRRSKRVAKSTTAGKAKGGEGEADETAPLGQTEKRTLERERERRESEKEEAMARHGVGEITAAFPGGGIAGARPGSATGTPAASPYQVTYARLPFPPSLLRFFHSISRTPRSRRARSRACVSRLEFETDASTWWN
jgi:hypothetical protein